MYKEARPPKTCEICGKKLYGAFYHSTRCAEHQTTKDADARLSRAAVAAKGHGMSYGQYMAAKLEGRV